MPSRPKFVDIRSYARKFTVEALETLAHVMRQPNSPPAARVLAANSLLDRGWGKAAQLVAVDGEIRQLVEVKLSVVTPKDLETPTTKLLTNTEKPNDINAVYLSADRWMATRSNSAEGSGPSSGRGGGTCGRGTLLRPLNEDCATVGQRPQSSSASPGR